MEDCARLFSGHYGVWGREGVDPGKHVRLSPREIGKRLSDEAAWLACAYVGNELAGYCIAVRMTVPEGGIVAWVTQLVVHTTYRNHGLATILLYGIWQFSDCYAWGITTANPYAVRALETATRRPCSRSRVVQEGAQLLPRIAEHVPYVPEALVKDEAGRLTPKVDTNFHIDLQEQEKMIERARRSDRRWGLGTLESGEEWFACTFASQAPEPLDPQRLERLLHGADDIWIQAYEGMTLDEAHKWHAYAEEEITNVLDLVAMPPGARVLDVGCGDGRHALALGRRGYRTAAVDISAHRIERAKMESVESTVRFFVDDARRRLPGGPFDLALCVYDVIGSSAKGDDDFALLRTIRSQLQTGAYLVASVMNADATLSRLLPGRRPQNVTEFLAALEKLPPSSTMEETGAVFDPEFLLLHDGVWYRKEQFTRSPSRLPSELIVRDKRYDVESLSLLFDQAGFDVAEVRPVQAGAWGREPPLARTDERAKELLVVARRRSD